MKFFKKSNTKMLIALTCTSAQIKIDEVRTGFYLCCQKSDERILFAPLTSQTFTMLKYFFITS